MSTNNTDVDIAFRLLAERKAAQSEVACLSDRERQAAALYAKGCNREEMASHMGVHAVTCSNLVALACSRLKVSRPELAVLMSKAGLA